MRRWLAKHLHPDQRFATLGMTILWIGIAMQMSTSLWQLAFHRHLPVPTDVLMQKLRDSKDPVESQSLIAELSAANTLNGIELARRQNIGRWCTRLSMGMIGASSVPTIIQFTYVRRRQRWLKAGCCGKCGYDLRESPERCPECGTAAGATM